MRIEVLGPGCQRCRLTEENVKKALRDLQKEAEVVKITDVEQIIERGVVQTPAVAIDGKIVIQGRVPEVEEIKKAISS